MATVDKRTTSKGRTSYRVRWREGGTRDGDWQSATFTRSGEAQRFKVLVEAAGHKWPTETTGAVSVPGTITVAELADRFLEDKAKRVRSDRTVADYRRDVDNWITPTFGDRQAGTITEAEIQAWVDGMVARGRNCARPVRRNRDDRAGGEGVGATRDLRRHERRLLPTCRVADQ